MIRQLLRLGVASTLLLSSSQTFAGWGSSASNLMSSDSVKKVQAQFPTIVAAAAQNPHLSTLVAALKAGGLVDALQAQGNMVVFAPTNEAFSALPSGTLDDLLKPENKDKLVNILKYHVATMKLPIMAKTLQGQDVAITPSGIKSINGAKVLNTIYTGNGTVYVIDKVLLPKS